MSQKLIEEWEEVYPKYRQEFGETFSSWAIIGRPDAMREALDGMKAALNGERGPVKHNELSPEVPEDAAI